MVLPDVDARQDAQIVGLEAVFKAADAANPASAGAFNRRLLTLPRLFQDPATTANGNWPGEVETAAAAVPAWPEETHHRGRWRPDTG